MLEKVKGFLQRHGALAPYVPLILWIGVIFFMSSGEASMSQTSRFIRPILEFLFPNAPEATLQLYHAYIRKFAHFAEYAMLALLALRAFSFPPGNGFRKSKCLAALALVVLIASLDEFNQSFNPARTGSPWDVLLDTAGGLTAIITYWAIAQRRPRGGDDRKRD